MKYTKTSLDCGSKGTLQSHSGRINKLYSITILFLLQSYETKKKGLGKVEEKQAVLHEEGKMDDGLDFSRSQEEESRTARVIRKCSSLFTQFIS
jgi:hypothetical protein